MKTLGDRLRYLRDLKGVSQKAVGDYLGISDKTVSGYERNVSEPDLETIAKLAEYYGVKSSYILGEKNKLDKHKDLLLEEIKKLGYDIDDMSVEEIAKLVVTALKISEITKSN